MTREILISPREYKQAKDERENSRVFWSIFINAAARGGNIAPHFSAMADSRMREVLSIEQQLKLKLVKGGGEGQS